MDKVGQRPCGWGRPGIAIKYHYFRDARSLCGKYAWFDAFGYLLEVDDGAPTTDDCMACRRALTKE